ncbi:MAG TPA: ATP-binding cassette domain-containing protein [Candidatus Polarisedimenticolia bacterium]|nr:ATP-binding cassette domain-containing protein [Candidatus Polarisedimenticolia bacterium]
MTRGAGEPAVSARGLSFTYRMGAGAALDGVNLDLPRGSWGLLLGATGAGKTTLVRTLNRTIPRFHRGRLEGSLHVMGEPTSGAGVAEMAARVGVVFQDFENQLLSTSCLLEVAFALESRQVPSAEIAPRASALLGSVGLDGFEQRDPATLSGGERQRLVIAAVLALEAPLLVLDEPASDLDPSAREAIYRLAGSAPGRTVLLVEHDLEGVPCEGPGFLLSDGRVASSWPSVPAAGMVELSPALEAAGVRPPPCAALAARLQEAWPGRLPRPLPLDPEGMAAALRSAGWRLQEAPAPVSPARGAAVSRCEELTHAYPGASGGRPALDAVDLEILEGRVTAIVGANGSGKTTLARHLAGLLGPSSGRVLHRGEEVSRIPPPQRAARIGFVFQNPDHQIFAATAGQEAAFGPLNLGAAPAEARRRCDAALEAVGLLEKADCDPFVLTKGERQRLAVASVLACEPSMLVLDEPTTGLDLREQRRMMRLLRDLAAAGRTIVMVTHALWLLDEADRVVVLARGRVAAEGGPAEVLAGSALERSGLRRPDLALFASGWGALPRPLDAWAGALRPPEAGAGP